MHIASRAERIPDDSTLRSGICIEAETASMPVSHAASLHEARSSGSPNQRKRLPLVACRRRAPPFAAQGARRRRTHLASPSAAKAVVRALLARVKRKRKSSAIKSEPPFVVAMAAWTAVARDAQWSIVICPRRSHRAGCLRRRKESFALVLCAFIPLVERRVRWKWRLSVRPAKPDGLRRAAHHSGQSH